jgi:hypothetical protein
MSGAVAAHAAYNGSGTQGLAVTNKIHDDDGDVMSVFWNKNDTTRQLLYGSSIIEIPASGSGGSLSAGGNQFFTVNNDIDAVGDLYLQITTGTASQTDSLESFGLLNAVKRIEYMVGTQVWQTLETADIRALNMTEMSEDSFQSFVLAMSGGFNDSGQRISVKTTSDGDINGSSAGSAQRTGVLRIPALSRSIGPKFSKFTDVSEQAYLLAGAPHQSVKIKVYMNSTNNLPSGTTFTLKLFGQCIVMCNEEREQIKAMPSGLPKRLKMTQNSTTSFVQPTTVAGQGVKSVVKLDLDHFSLYASHIILVVNPTGTNAASCNASIESAELKLNSSSFSGTLGGPLLTGAAADALGLYSNGFYIGGANFTDNYYIFPLASLAYGGSSVPLNRFDNIRMELNVIMNTVGDGTDKPFNVSATCVGETTALYKGGAASLAMY